LPVVVVIIRIVRGLALRIFDGWRGRDSSFLLRLLRLRLADNWRLL
jgi:hypothetical protein